MFVRIVKLSSKPSKVKTFLYNFENQEQYIRSFPRCRLLKLYRDKHQLNIFFTHSYWKTEQDLKNYRNSELFKGIWTGTKIYFNNKPQVWSVTKVVSLQQWISLLILF